MEHFESAFMNGPPFTEKEVREKTENDSINTPEHRSN